MRKILDDKLAFIMVIFLFTLAFTLNAMHGAGTSVGHTPLVLPDVTLVAHGPRFLPIPGMASASLTAPLFRPIRGMVSASRTVRPFLRIPGMASASRMVHNSA
jgi:hypothetical protein